MDSVMIDTSEDSYFQQLRALNEHYSCFVTLLEPEKTGSGNELQPRLGMPRTRSGLTVGIKDCIDIGGVRGTWGSGVHRARIASTDAAVIVSLRAMGAKLVATTNLHEFAFGGTTQNPHFGNCRNAWSDDRVPGGSSGGSAVAVALGLCDVALGTDTGASVRMPAALNGVIGFRPTHGAVSSRGVMPVSPPHDTVGVLGRDIETVRRVFVAIQGLDPLDPYSQVRPAAAHTDETGNAAIRLGVAKALVDGCEPAIVRAFEDGLRVCRDLAFARTDIASLSFVDVASHLSAIVIADAASFHRERLASQPENVGAAIHSRIARGLRMTAVEYADHLRWMEGYQHEVAMTFRNVDFIIAPSVPVSPLLIVDCDNAVTATQMLSRNCWFAPGAGLPAITVPCGLDDNGIPVGLQIAGPRWSDLRLLALAQAILNGLPSIGRPAEFVNMGS